MRSYHVNVSREDGFWVASVDGMRGGTVEIRRLPTLEREVRMLVCGLMDVTEDSFSLWFDYTKALAPVAARAVESQQLARARVRAAESIHEHHQRVAARELLADEVSPSDSANLLGVSEERLTRLISTG